MYRVYVAEKISGLALKYLKDNGFEIKFGSSLEEDYTLQMLKDCDAVIVRVLKITDKIIEQNPRLKIISKHGVGFDSIDLKKAKERNVIVTYTPQANSLSVAEHVVALMLSFSHKICQSQNEYKKGNYFIKNRISVGQISGKKIGLIGCGNIARNVARILFYGFNMEIFAYDPYVAKQTVPDYIQLKDSINDFIQETDFISLHIPYTGINSDFITKNEFDMMKKEAIFINTARGELVNTADLIQALRERKIAGALLDVTYPEPLPSSNELFELDNVIITPHCGAISKESMEQMGLQAAKNIVDFFKGDICQANVVLVK